MTETEKRIASQARAINFQISELAYAKSRLIKNIMVTEDGRICQIENHMHLQQAVDDKENVLRDMLRVLDQELKERDGVET